MKENILKEQEKQKLYYDSKHNTGSTMKVYRMRLYDQNKILCSIIIINNKWVGDTVLSNTLLLFYFRNS